MKKSTILIIALLISCTAFAQIPNNSFETWTHQTAGGGYDTPDGWGNLNPYTSLIPGSPVYTCEKGTPGAPGSSFLKLTSKTTFLGTVPGVAGTGTINTTAFTITGGFPFSTRPASLVGNWQYMAFGADAGHIAVFLSKWKNATSKRDTVAFIDHVLPGMEMAWVPFSIDLNYYSGKNPDTALIVLSSSGTTPVANSYLYVDSLGFAGTVPSGVVNVRHNMTTSVIYPNPATESTNISYYSTTGGNVTINVIDLNGRLVTQIKNTARAGENNFKLDLTGVAKGTYIIHISGTQGTEEQKLMVE